MNHRLLSVRLEDERDVAAARQRARHIAALCGFEPPDQTRIATAVSEIARNAVAYGREGQAVFAIEELESVSSLSVLVSDNGPGIADLDGVLENSAASHGGTGIGLSGTRRLMDGFRITSSQGKGTRVWFAKALPGRQKPDGARLAEIIAALGSLKAVDPFAEVRTQNHELMASLAELRARQEDLNRINAELEDTNRGVVALYAELDERAEELRRASELKSRFLSHMSHEFRTPLNSIMALCRLLSDRVDGPLTAEQERQVAYIRQSAESLTELVNDLLDLAKVEAGKIELRPQFVSIPALFGALRGVLKPLQTRGAVELVFEDPANAPELYTDEGKLSQILRNLVSNALKFTDFGEVRVHANYDARSNTCTFSVRDTGIGIAFADHERIFQEFAQVENRFQGGVRGTGLGLPLSRRLAELLGGTLMVESAPGRGSCFTLNIRARLEIGVPAQVVAPSRLASRQESRRRVLVIDDEETFRYLFRQMLAGEPDLDVLEAATGGEGLSRAVADCPDLVFLDLRMPGLDGYEVLRRLKSEPGTRHIPVIVCTSSVLHEQDKRELRLASSVMQKADLSRGRLAAALRDATIPPSSRN